MSGRIALPAGEGLCSGVGHWKRMTLAWHAGGVAVAGPPYVKDEVPARYSSGYERGGHVSKSVLDAIREGDWHFEPEQVDATHYQPTTAVPGSRKKLDILAARARAGLPLWHQDDRTDYEQCDVQ